MRKTFRQFEPGTADFVVHHARYMASRGRNPSQAYLTERNPRKSLASAVRIGGLVEQNVGIGNFMARLGKAILSKKSFNQMGEDEIQAALRHIVSTSSNENEVKSRIRSELGCPYAPMVSVLKALSAVGREAKELCLAMGGVTLNTGELVQVMVFGPTGSTVSV